jgi:hypothetical protein
VTVVSKKPNCESEGDEAHISSSDPEPLNRLTTRKRKADQLINFQILMKKIFHHQNNPI